MSLKRDPAEFNGERRALIARISLYATLTLTVVNIVGATAFWISLPERLKQISLSIADHEVRIRAAERLTSDQATTLSRIDERTRAIQENVAELKRDFAFRATAKP